MSTDGDEDHGFQIVGAIRRQKVIVMVTTLVFVSLAIGFVAVQQRPYRSVVTLLLSPASTDDNVVVGAQEADRHVLNERNFLQSDAVEQAVTERLGYDAHITTSGTSGDDIIEVHAEDPDAARAAAVAEAYANVYLDLRRDDLGAELDGRAQSVHALIAEVDRELAALGTDAASDTQRSRLADRRSKLQDTSDQLELQAATIRASGVGRVIRVGTPQARPVTSALTRYVIVALFAGLIVGGALALARDALDGTVTSANNYGGSVPVLVVIPPPRRERSSAAAARRPPAGAESLALLRVKLVGSDRQRCLRTLQIAAARGTTLTAETAYGLARAYESAGDRVLLVSGNLRKSSSRQLYDVPLAPGLGSYVTARGVGVKPFQVDGYEHLAAVPADRAGLRTNHLPTARELQPVFSAFRGLADVVITDSGPVLAPDGLELATVADATVLVAVEGLTKSSDLRLAAEQLDAIGVQCLGVVVYAFGWARRTRNSRRLKRDPAVLRAVPATHAR